MLVGKANISQEWKGLLETNTPAYKKYLYITVVKVLEPTWGLALSFFTLFNLCLSVVSCSLSLPSIINLV
jgi:hypothetical protein